jgi:prevent-host-death family protein
MTRVGVHEAKTHLSELLRRVATGEEILIVRGGQPAARLVPVEQAGKRLLGTCPDIRIAEDFDAPLPEDVIDTFYR